MYNEGSNRIGVVEFDGKRRAIYSSLVPEAQVGDEVLFHAGFATERIKRKASTTHAGAAAGRGKTKSRRTNSKRCRASRLFSELDPQQLRKLIPLAQDEQLKRSNYFSGGR